MFWDKKETPAPFISEFARLTIVQDCWDEYVRTGIEPSEMAFFRSSARVSRVRNADDLIRALDYGETDSIIYADEYEKAARRLWSNRLKRSISAVSPKKPSLPDLGLKRSATDLYGALKSTTRLSIRSPPSTPTGTSIASGSTSYRSDDSLLSTPSSPTPSRRGKFRPLSAPAFPGFRFPMRSRVSFQSSASKTSSSTSGSTRSTTTPKTPSKKSSAASAKPKRRRHSRRTNSTPVVLPSQQEKFLVASSDVPKKQRRQTLDGQQRPFVPLPKIWEETLQVATKPKPATSPALPATPRLSAPAKLIVADPRLRTPACFAHAPLTWDEVVTLPWAAAPVPPQEDEVTPPTVVAKNEEEEIPLSLGYQLFGAFMMFSILSTVFATMLFVGIPYVIFSNRYSALLFTFVLWRLYTVSFDPINLPELAFLQLYFL